MPLTDLLAYLAYSLLLKNKLHEPDIHHEERTTEVYHLPVLFSQLQPFNTSLINYRIRLPSNNIFRKSESVKNCRI